VSEFVEQMRAMAAASLFPLEGELFVPGLGGAVTVARDSWGVPSISAASQDDLWFAQGFVTAGERLFQLDLALRAANGRLSELFADKTLQEDRFARTIGLHRAGARYVAGWDERSLNMHARFRAGVFAWIEQMPAAPIEYLLLDAKPELPEDPAAWASAFAYLGWGLSGNWDTELLRAQIAERAGPDAVGALLPAGRGDAPAIVAGALGGALLDALPHPRGQGSNNWVVSGEHTASGKPLLANDPHLQVMQPGAWLQIGLEAPGYHARGVALTFSPGVLLGSTNHHAWSVTNVSGDVQDLYVEHLNDDRTAAEFRGAWEPLTVTREEIVVRGTAEPLVIEVRESRHGPLLDHAVVGQLGPDFVPLPPEPVYALRWTGAEHGIRPALILDAAEAGDFQAFRAAVLGVGCPGQNFLYADVDGNIGYACTGAFPVRAGGDGTAPVPGWTGEHEWAGVIAPDDLPWSLNPERGYLVTANNRIHDDQYPHLIGRDFHPPYRARRITELLAARSDHDPASMRAIQMDTVSQASLEILPVLLDAVGDPHDEDAVKLLAGWDGDMRADSAAAALFNVWCDHIARRALTPILGDVLVRAYHAWREPWQCRALPMLLRREGPGDTNDWLSPELIGASLQDARDDLDQMFADNPADRTWGGLHQATFAHPLAAVPGLEDLFVAAHVCLGGDEQTVGQAGIDGRDGYPVSVVASWRAVWDLADRDSTATGVVPTGVSGNPASPHWNDQTTAWLGGDPPPTEPSPVRLTLRPEPQ
jgi:penicillin amidase